MTAKTKPARTTIERRHTEAGAVKAARARRAKSQLQRIETPALAWGAPRRKGAA